MRCGRHVGLLAARRFWQRAVCVRHDSLDLRKGEVGDAEDVILLKLVLHEVVAGGQSAKLCCGT